MIIARRMIAASAVVNEALVADDGNNLQKGFSVDAKPATPKCEAEEGVTSQHCAGDAPN
jgi:hypothetical protein